MRISVNQNHNFSSTQEKVELEKMMLELDHLKRQSERLDRINKLHERLAGVLSFTGIIEAYSIWLSPYVAHELIGYNNEARRKKHLFCSYHGPRRREAVAFAEEVIAGGSEMVGSCIERNGRFAYKWVFETSEDSGVFLILRKDQEFSDHETELISQSLEVLAECLRRGLEYDELIAKANCDQLTGLFNRRVFEERIHAMMDGANRYNHPLSMISMDLDRFKEINDNLGHQRGDEVLIAVADVLKQAVRSTDLLVRMGGDEFIIVLDQTGMESARILAERLCAAVDGLNIWAADGVKLGVSIGLSEMEKNEGLTQWLERTDDILYHAKAEGRSRVEVD